MPRSIRSESDLWRRERFGVMRIGSVDFRAHLKPNAKANAKLDAKPAGIFAGAHGFSRRQFLLTVSSLIAFCDAQAHDFHVSICDIKFNPRSGNTEIVHSYPMHDIESAFWLMYGRQMDTTLAADEALLRTYFDKNFVIETAKKSQLKIRWVGVSSDADTLTVYQELPGVRLASIATIQNKVLMEHFPTQTNNVNVRTDGAGGTTKTLMFDRKNTVQRLT